MTIIQKGRINPDSRQAEARNSPTGGWRSIDPGFWLVYYLTVVAPPFLATPREPRQPVIHACGRNHPDCGNYAALTRSCARPAEAADRRRPDCFFDCRRRRGRFLIAADRYLETQDEFPLRIARRSSVRRDCNMMRVERVGLIPGADLAEVSQLKHWANSGRRR